MEFVNSKLEKLEFVIVTCGIRFYFDRALQSGLLLPHKQRDFIDT